MIERGMALGLAGDRERLVVDMELGIVLGSDLRMAEEVLVDMGLVSDLRNLAERGMDFDSHPGVVRSSEREDIVPDFERDIVAGRKELVGRTEVVGDVEAGLRNNRCLT